MGLLDTLFDNYLFDAQFLLMMIVTIILYSVLSYLKNAAKGSKMSTAIMLSGVMSFVLFDQRHRFNFSTQINILLVAVTLSTIYYAYRKLTRSNRVSSTA